MDFELSADQELIVKTFRDFFGRWCTWAEVRAADATGGHDASLWQRLVDLGAPTLALPEAAGGGGGSLLDAALVGLEAGRVLAPVPYAETVAALRLVGCAFGGLPDGAAAEAAWTAAPAPTTEVSLTGGLLHGRARLVPAGGVADRLVVLGGGTLAVVDTTAAGVERRAVSNLGHLPLGDIDLRAARPTAVAPCPPSAARRFRAERRTLEAARLVGCARSAPDLAVNHVKERRQFGRPLGSFQALQHRLADRLIEAVGDGRLEHAFRHSQVATIYGGASEVRRDIVARFGLGLPVHA